MNPQPKSIELSLPALKIILFGDERLEGVDPKSKGVGDTAKVKVVPLHFGLAIQTLDKSEEYFHVEIEPCSWAEIWLISEWKESNTRRSRLQALSFEERQTRDKQRSRVNEIKEVLRSKGLDKVPGWADQLAAAMMDAYKKGHISKMLTVLDLADKFNKFEEEDKQENKEA